jgi:hypothetical protein
MVWGEQEAMAAMQARFEQIGWTWATGMLGSVTPFLVLSPPKSVDDAEITRLIESINAGKFGKLNSGYAQFDLPSKPSGRTSL